MAAVEAFEVERPQAGREVLADADFPWRVLGLLNVFRLIVAMLLLGVYYLSNEPRIIGANEPSLAVGALLALLGGGIAMIVLLRQRFPGVVTQSFFQFGIDIVTLTLLTHASGGISSGVGGVLVISVGSLAMLLPRERAFLMAALTALVLLGEQTLAQWQGMTESTQYASVGILGAVIFVITAVMQVLRTRMVETEALAEQRGVDLRNLAELNEYIIQHLRESIVVVDSDDHVRLINESALRHLGADSADGGVPMEALSAELAQRLRDWREGVADGSTAVAIGSADGSTTIRPQFAPLAGGRAGGVVIFLEDTSLIAERVQQAKLAALGRLSASIAHEIRNPVGAMSHAGQLLAESPGIASADQRLTDIIRVNARRVSHIVESVLALSRRGKADVQLVELRPWLASFVHEFLQTLELPEGSVTIAPGEDLEVQMDPTHLHQVLWNLCDNAVKYASEAAGAISVEIRHGRIEATGRAFLEVADRGPGVPKEKVDEIFEPFFTGQPGGTGLGLYISRELAERNGATLRYHPRREGGSTFRLVFADPNRWNAGEGAL
jgi:two-component system sensor histidine kinase PilS (NtrC family)